MLKRVLMSVDFPRPDSPEQRQRRVSGGREPRKQSVAMTRTDHHGGELEALPDALPVHLVRKVGKSNISHELLANDVGCAGI